MPSITDELSDAILDLMLFVDLSSSLPKEIISYVDRLRDLRKQLDESDCDYLFDREEGPIPDAGSTDD